MRVEFQFRGIGWVVRRALLASLVSVLCTSCQCTREIDIEGQILESCENPIGVEGVQLTFDHLEGREEVTTGVDGHFRFQFTTESSFNIWGGGPEIWYLVDSTYGTFDLPEGDVYDYGSIYLNHTEEVVLKFSGIPENEDFSEYDSLYISFGGADRTETYLIDRETLVNDYITDPMVVTLLPGKLSINAFCNASNSSTYLLSGSVNFEDAGLRCFDEPLLIKLEYYEP
ncbi:MAG: hypothetical protein HWE14_09640 [Flavobacteriia bacterium]|nr:hypothetical protein [Flavobacteriia bacterium]